jgi:hypothetical protein
MDDAAFVIWRPAIALLTAAQRSLAFFDLAFAEADDPADRFYPEDDAETARPNEIANAPAAVAPIDVSSAIAPAPGSDLLSRMGSDRIANSGCPHCGGGSIGCEPKLWD